MIQKYRKYAGLFLILIAVGALVAWEAFGREMVLMDKVLVARQEIKEGEPLSPELFRAVAVPRDALVSGFVAPDQESQIDGAYSAEPIPEGAQLSAKFMIGEDERLDADKSFYVIKGQWIFMRSSALRRGDLVDIVSSDGSRELGTYSIAFVKNTEDKEISEITGGNDIFSNKSKGDRTKGSDMIDHVEIKATRADYMKIKAFSESESGPSLIIIQKETNK